MKSRIWRTQDDGPKGNGGLNSQEMSSDFKKTGDLLVVVVLW